MLCTWVLCLHVCLRTIFMHAWCPRSRWIIAFSCKCSLVPFPFQVQIFYLLKNLTSYFFLISHFYFHQVLISGSVVFILLVSEKLMYPDSSLDFKFRPNSAGVSLNTFKKWSSFFVFVTRLKPGRTLLSFPTRVIPALQHVSSEFCHITLLAVPHPFLQFVFSKVQTTVPFLFSDQKYELYTGTHIHILQTHSAKIRWQKGNNSFVG